MVDHEDYDVHVKRNITISRRPEELYKEWRSPEKMGCFVAGSESVRMEDDRRSWWKVRVPGIGTESWEAEITEDRVNEAIGWQTIGKTKFDHRGLVTFRPTRDGKGTEVSLEIDTRLPTGVIGNTVGKLVGHSPEDYISGTLHNFKQLMETGEVATSRGPSGRARILTGLGPKIAIGSVAAAALVTAGVMYPRRSHGGER